MICLVSHPTCSAPPFKLPVASVVIPASIADEYDLDGGGALDVKEVLQIVHVAITCIQTFLEG